MSDDLSSDLRWSAYRYIANEMTDDERVRFELRLADDEAACEAVENAVELDEAIRLASEAPVVARPPQSTFFSRHSVAWAAACTVCAACLALAFFSWRLATIDSRRVAPEIANDPERRSESDLRMQEPISIAWAKLQDRDLTERNDSSASRWAEAAAMSDTEHRQRSIGELESKDMNDMVVPQWLLTATAGDAANIKGVP